jgi:hypothetical protein
MRWQMSTVRRLLLVTTALVVGASCGMSSTTDAAWLDKSFVGSTISTTHWASTGSADAQILAITATSGAGGVSSTLDSSSASPASPGPNTSSTLSRSSTGVMGLGLTASSAMTSAQYSITQSIGQATVQDAAITLNVIGVVNLGQILRISGSNGPIQTIATCPATGAVTATATDLSDVTVYVLGTSTPLTLSNGGNTGTASRTGITVGLASVDESVTLTRSTTASTSPSQPSAEAKITVAVTLTIRVGLTTTNVTVSGTIARGACALTV